MICALPSEIGRTRLISSSQQKKKGRQGETLAPHSTTTTTTQGRSNSEILDLSWRDSSTDPFHWWDNRHRKMDPLSSDFTHKTTKHFVWIYGLCNPCWVQDKLRKRGILSTENVQDGDSGAEEEKKRRDMKHTNYVAQQAEEVLIVTHGNQQKYQDSAGGAITLVASLQICAKEMDLHTGHIIHADIVRKGLPQENVIVGNALVNMYAKCGVLDKAQKMFDDLLSPGVALWNALMRGYTQHGCGEEALSCFEQMLLKGVCPSANTFVCILKACGSIGALDKGKEIHVEIVRERLLEQNVMVASALVDMYAKCGALEKAVEVFDEFPVRDVVSWNILIAGYTQQRQYKEALNCFDRMRNAGFSPNAVTFVCILKACGRMGALDKGKEVHAQIVREGLLENNLVLDGALVDMYARCGAIVKAQDVFDELPARNVALWTVLIEGYARHGHANEALNCFEQMQLEGFSPSAVTLMCTLRACGSLGALDKGKEIHAQIVTAQLLEKDIRVGTALVDMYAKCGALAEAQGVFDELPVRDVISWTTLVMAYAQHEHGDKALNCFEAMQKDGFFPDVVTFACILKACSFEGVSNKGQSIHSQIVKAGLLDEDVHIGTAVVDMYGKCGALAEAQEVFDKLQVRDGICWTALILGYAQHELGDEALNIFERMQLEGFFPDAVTFACILKACGSIGAGSKGQKVHSDVVRFGLLKKDIVVGTALVDMYANSGMLAEAQKVFDKLPFRDVVSWSALMVGYAQLGNDEMVFNLYEKMVEEGTKPNSITFTIVLNACSHRGLLDHGQSYFEIICKGCGFIPTLEHYFCIVDLCARAGCVHKASLVIEKMPFSISLMPWRTLLSACRNWGNMKLGRWAFEYAVQVDENDDAAYVCMSNIYAAAGSYENANMEYPYEPGISF